MVKEWDYIIQWDYLISSNDYRLVWYIPPLLEKLPFAGWIYIGYAPWKYIQYKSVYSTLIRSQILVRPEGIVGRRSCCAMVSSPVEFSVKIR
jgi:hypothetical protein